MKKVKRNRRPRKKELREMQRIEKAMTVTSDSQKEKRR